MKLISWVLLHEYFQGTGINRNTGSPGRGVLPIVGHTRRLCPKGVSFSSLQYTKG